MAPSEPTTLIIGAGVFGVSTAYHLSLNSYKPSSITIVDRGSLPSAAPHATQTNGSPPKASLAYGSSFIGASSDINKIIRADYSSLFYMKLAQSAIHAWSTWSLIRPYYHRTGWIHLDQNGSDQNGSDLSKRILRNFALAESDEYGMQIEFGDSANMSRHLSGILRDTDFKALDLHEEGSYLNPGAGWAEADKAMEAMLLDCVMERGVRYRQGNVVELVMHAGAGHVTGVRLQDGTVIEADRIVMATGAWTSVILSRTEDSLKIDPRMRVENQVKAAGVCCAHFKLSKQEKAVFDQVPVIVYGANGEMIPPPPSGLLKFTNAHSVGNSIRSASGHPLSYPPANAQGLIPEKLKEETATMISRMLPAFKDRSITYWRLCWDSITPSQDQLICRHPDKRLSNIIMAVGGSFHSWKFLPVIGKYVVNVVEGKSNGVEMDERWAWKTNGWYFERGPQEGVHEKLVPRREYRDL
ncbi:hypothetical protein MMC09_000987 [Bachmanniomyces sp. S44760]|nr:hypothetical protein [Bachmanniomyces sp. S44760]